MSVLLQTTQPTKYFGDTHVVGHVDFCVTEGEVLALIGSSPSTRRSPAGSPGVSSWSTSSTS